MCASPPVHANNLIISLIKKISFFSIYIGTAEERGINKWRKHEHPADDSGRDNSLRIYDLPCIQKYLDRINFFRYVPFCPRFSLKRKRSEKIEETIENDTVKNISQNDVQFSINSEKL